VGKRIKDEMGREKGGGGVEGGRMWGGGREVTRWSDGGGGIER